MENGKKLNRQIAKDMIENRIRGKWVGCNFEIEIETDCIYFSNIQWFKYRDLINFNLILSIALKDDFSTKKLCERFNNTSSCIVVTNDSRKDFQKRIIDEITKEEIVAKGLEQTFAVINNLLPKEKHILVAHGILGLDFKDLESEGKPRTLERIYNRALDDFSWGMQMV